MAVPRQSFFGQVIKTAMQKTIKVRVEKVKMHPLVNKPIRSHNNYLVHDEDSKCVVGDYVKIDSCNKISKMKHFTLGEIVTPAQRYMDSDGHLHAQGINPKTLAAEYELENYNK